MLQKLKSRTEELGNDRRMDRKGQTGVVISVIIGVILVNGVVRPIAHDVIATANLTGTTAMIVSFIPVGFGVAGLILTFSLVQ